jgi:hypothetical protein
MPAGATLPPMRSALPVALLVLSFLKASAFDPATLSIEQLKNGIENQHPAYFYYLAKKLFAAGQKDDAVSGSTQANCVTESTSL